MYAHGTPWMKGIDDARRDLSQVPPDILCREENENEGAPYSEGKRNERRSTGTCSLSSPQQQRLVRRLPLLLLLLLFLLLFSFRTHEDQAGEWGNGSWWTCGRRGRFSRTKGR
jgi:hypothetical protein